LTSSTTCHQICSDWSCTIFRDDDAPRHIQCEFRFENALVGRASFIQCHLRGTPFEDVLAPLEGGDIYCAMDELERYLTGKRGTFLWFDAFQREPLFKGHRGKLTQCLAKILTEKCLTVPKGTPILIFPCTYGSGDHPEDEGRRMLAQWYQEALYAKVIENTPFVTLAVS
jgi:hypothetical protein